MLYRKILIMEIQNTNLFGKHLHNFFLFLVWSGYFNLTFLHWIGLSSGILLGREIQIGAYIMRTVQVNFQESLNGINSPKNISHAYADANVIL